MEVVECLEILRQHVHSKNESRSITFLFFTGR